EERKKNYQEKITGFQRQLKELENEETQLANELETVHQLEQSVEKEAELTDTINHHKANREQTIHDLELKRSTRKKKTQAIEDEEREVKQLAKLHDNFMKKIQEQEVQASRLD